DCDGYFRVTLPDGREVHGSGRDWPFRLGDSGMPANARVLQYTTSGTGTVVTDNRTKIDDAYNDSEARKPGGCSYAPGSSKPGSDSPWTWTVLSGLVIALLSRRRRATVSQRD